VIGAALGAVTWAYEMARALGARAQFTERHEGRMCLRRGFRVLPGERVLVVEDVLTTGGSAREVIDVLAGHGLKPCGIAAIVNRSGGNPFEHDGLPFEALVEIEARTWKPEICPPCRAGGRAHKPGSRAGPAAAGPAGGQRA